MKVSLFIIKFLLVGALFLVSNENLYMSNSVDRGTFYDLFYSWMENLYTQGMQITGYVANSEWLPENAEIPPDK